MSAIFPQTYKKLIRIYIDQKKLIMAKSASGSKPKTED